MMSSFDLSRTLPVDGGLLVPCSLPGPPIIKQLMDYGAWPGWMVSVNVFPLTLSQNNVEQNNTIDTKYETKGNIVNTK